MSTETHMELPVPAFYDPSNAEQWEYRPDEQALFEEAGSWRSEHDLRAAADDRVNIHLLLIDLQKDFCFPQGSLYVGGRSGRGAIDDNDRIARFVYRNLHVITKITCTLDTHFPYQIFFPSFWVDEDGNAPTPHQEVSVEDLEAGRLQPNPALAPWVSGGDTRWLRRQAEFYCRELAKSGKYKLYLWPPHCLLGSAGHALTGIIHEARLFHSFARLSEGAIEIKGATPLTEYYSVIGPEVTRSHDGAVLAQANVDFLDILATSDAVAIAGQAASHCVKSTIEDLLERMEPGLARKVYILRDCMSPVAVPDPENPGEFVFDFTPQAEAAITRFADAGMHVVESSLPVSEWPDFPLG